MQLDSISEHMHECPIFIILILQSSTTFLVLIVSIVITEQIEQIEQILLVLYWYRFYLLKIEFFTKL